MKKQLKLTTIALLVASILTACSQEKSQPNNTSENQLKAPTTINSTLTAKDAETFLDNVAKDLVKLNLEGSRAEWIYQNFITDDTAALSSAANQKLTEAAVRYAVEAAKFDHVKVNDDQRRKLNILKQSIVMPAPQDPKKSAELAEIGAKLGSLYGKGTYTTKADETLSLGDMTARMATSRDYDELLELWQGWREISPPMKALYTRQTELANEGAQSLGYKDLGAMWRSNYDMPAEDFAKELDRLWTQVKP